MRVYCGEQRDWVLLSVLSAVFVADWKALLISLSFDANGGGIFDRIFLLLLLLKNLRHCDDEGLYLFITF